MTLRSSGAYRRAIMAQLLATYGPRCRADVCTLPTRDYPGPRTIGHAVALARGGSDAWANLRIEHATCNYRAGARGPRPRGQLLNPR